MDERLPRRVADKIIPEPNSGCWLWMGCLTRGGYGQLHSIRKTVYAHRYVFELLKGQIPLGLQLDHLCRNRCCVNPDHLESVTQHLNLIRGNGFSGTNSRKIHCDKGHSLENAYPVKKGGRLCRECNARRCRMAYLERKKKREIPTGVLTRNPELDV